MDEKFGPQNLYLLISEFYLAGENQQETWQKSSIAMAVSANLHFVLFPLMAQGHMIPMVDIARLLAQRGVKITIFTTPHNASRFEGHLARLIGSGLHIQVIKLDFPCEEAGLPVGCENVDLLPSSDYALPFFTAANMLQKPAEVWFQQLSPRPSCIISDMCLPYTMDIASKFDIPRLSFIGFGCFALFILHKLKFFEDVLESVSSEHEYFVVPGLPDKIELTKAQIPGPWKEGFKELRERMNAAEMASHGVVVNSCEELEGKYAEEYKKEKENKVWCIGPVSLCNKNSLEMAERGRPGSIEGQYCLDWLDKHESKSVIYVCLGSLCNHNALQMMELGLGLEASNRPFVWVIREAENSDELKILMESEKFEKRIEGKGLLIWGWAPQLLILSHPAIGGFLTHCGWNSTTEGIAAGVPMVTWPLFAEQFLNEKVVEQILKIGVKVGAETPTNPIFGINTEVQVKREDVKKAVETLMEEGEEGEGRRRRARELGEMVKMAGEEGGSSYLNLTSLIQEIMNHAASKEQSKFL